MSEKDDPIASSPLAELFPTLGRVGETPLEPIHPRVFETDAGIGRAMVFVSYAPLDDVREFHRLMRLRVEAALLAELSTLPYLVFEKPLRALHLHLFEEPAFDPLPALKAFGFEPYTPGDESRDELARLRAEAQRVGRSFDDLPARSYRAVAADHALEMIDRELRHLLDKEVFGERPGAMIAKLSGVMMRRRDLPAFEADAASLDRLEAALFPRAFGQLRMIPPAIFQAFADGVAVTAHRTHGAHVEWAEVHRDEEALPDPPLVRARRGEEDWVHLPLGLHLIRWCVMPREADEEIPSVSEWLRDQFEG